MASNLPYMLSVGLISKILEKIQIARRPERFTLDFLETKLGHSGGSARAVIPLLKRMGFLGSDGSPTSLYDQFRNSNTQGSAVAQGMKTAFGELFERNEYVYDMPRPKLTEFVVEVTGGTKSDAKTQAIVGTFWALRELADFEGDAPIQPEQEKEPVPAQVSVATDGGPTLSTGDNVELRVG